MPSRAAEIPGPERSGPQKQERRCAVAGGRGEAYPPTPHPPSLSMPQLLHPDIVNLTGLPAAEWRPLHQLQECQGSHSNVGDPGAVPHPATRAWHGPASLHPGPGLYAQVAIFGCSCLLQQLYFATGSISIPLPPPCDGLRMIAGAPICLTP